MTAGTCDLEWDDAATLLRAEAFSLEDREDDSEATSLRSPPLEALTAPHRTQEEAEDTASAEFAPLRLDAGFELSPP